MIFRMGDDGYEIHSILEFGDKPAEGLWWVLSPAGKSPPIRAGAGSLVIKKKDEEFDESIVFSGGATPAGYLSDIVKLDLIHGEWQTVSNQVISQFETVETPGHFLNSKFCLELSTAI